MSYFNEIKTRYANSPSIDAFARARVASPASLFDGKLISPTGIFQWDDQETAGSGTGSTWDANAATVLLEVGAAAGTRVRQTKQRFNYQPGKSQSVNITGVFGSPATGITRRVGCFDADNGIFLEIGPTTPAFKIRNQGSDSGVNQANWNIDKFDGTGPSGVTLDFSKAQILAIDYEWLGVGRVRVGFYVNGAVVYAHQFLHANAATSTYMGSPNLPIRYEIANDGNGGAAELLCICSNVSSEGGQHPIGSPRGSIGVNQVGVSTGDTVVLAGVRPQASYLDTVLQILHLSAIAGSANDAFKMMLLLNPTHSVAPTWANINNSAMQHITAATGTITDFGTVLMAGNVVTGDAINIDFRNDASPGALIDGTVDEIVLVGTAVTNSISMSGSLNWFEFH